MVQSVANAGAWYADDGDEYGGCGWDEWTSLEDEESPAIVDQSPCHFTEAYKTRKRSTKFDEKLTISHCRSTATEVN